MVQSTPSSKAHAGVSSAACACPAAQRVRGASPGAAVALYQARKCASVYGAAWLEATNRSCS